MSRPGSRTRRRPAWHSLSVPVRRNSTSRSRSWHRRSERTSRIMGRGHEGMYMAADAIEDAGCIIALILPHVRGTAAFVSFTRIPERQHTSLFVGVLAGNGRAWFRKGPFQVTLSGFPEGAAEGASWTDLLWPLRVPATSCAP